MSMIGRMALAAGAAVSMALLAACSDSPTAVNAPAARVPKVGFAVNVGDVTTNTPEVTLLKICKLGDVAGSFTTTAKSAGEGGSGNPSISSGLAVAPGQCKVAAIDNGDASAHKGDFLGVSEAAQANVTETLDSCVLNPNTAIPCNDSYFINTAHGIVLTFTNTSTPPPPPEVCDFSTFGGFVVSPNNVSWGGNAGRVDGGFAYGDLNFVNHTTGDHIHVWNVTDYGHPTTGPLSQFEDSRLAFGLGSVNGGPVNVPVEWRFLDAGEPAKKLGDMVYLKVGNTVLIPEMNVGGGNIQLHSKCKKAPKAEKH